MDLDPQDGTWPLDKDGFLADLLDKRTFLADGYRAGHEAAVPGLEASGLLFAGMGFSGASSDLVKDACARALDIPFTIVRHYQFPHHVKRDWHMLAVSYSGETEETLAVTEAAKRRGVGITSFSTGGTITELADRNVVQPKGHQPRAALGYAWLSMLGFLEGSGMLHETVPIDDMLAAVAEVDASCGPDVPTEQNEAKQLALQLAKPIPQIYATPAFYGVAHHFRGMLNENAKKIAGTELIPDCNHNDLSGWGGDEENRRHFAIVTLSHGQQHPELQKRIAFMKQRYTSWGIPWHHRVFAPIRGFADHVVEQARAIQFLDYTSFYTAMLRDQDPSEIREIKGLKSYLRG